MGDPSRQELERINAGCFTNLLVPLQLGLREVILLRVLEEHLLQLRKMLSNSLSVVFCAIFTLVCAPKVPAEELSPMDHRRTRGGRGRERKREYGGWRGANEIINGWALSWCFQALSGTAGCRLIGGGFRSSRRRCVPGGESGRWGETAECSTAGRSVAIAAVSSDA